MDSRDNKIKIIHRLLNSFLYAVQGLREAFKTELNLRIHVVVALFVILTGVTIGITKTEWIIIVALIGGMISVELMNTAVERTVDLITSEFHPLAKQAKDIAAAAVTVYAVTAVIIGVIIFAPYLILIIQ
ncbi:diacylglycerol kinase family protein [Bacillus sp. HMF5848]|uniref:diacylglycerol kinase n=1 Tax=Bacillus sp. HMF5848 TaxID=2495421 RepID=UPI000F79E04C|nr:diacylglycerol kinase family protein [Bacillus sp. HMF5848]RSK27886.1 diacylglycerol kinase family protein [Bacillus sp. HMF5848]